MSNVQIHPRSSRSRTAVGIARKTCLSKPTKRSILLLPSSLPLLASASPPPNAVDPYPPPHPVSPQHALPHVMSLHTQVGSRQPVAARGDRSQTLDPCRASAAIRQLPHGSARGMHASTPRRSSMSQIQHRFCILRQIGSRAVSPLCGFTFVYIVKSCVWRHSPLHQTPLLWGDFVPKSSKPCSMDDDPALHPSPS
jgi:hypothetical protein